MSTYAVPADRKTAADACAGQLPAGDVFLNKVRVTITAATLAIESATPSPERAQESADLPAQEHAHDAPTDFNEGDNR